MLVFYPFHNGCVNYKMSLLIVVSTRCLARQLRDRRYFVGSIQLGADYILYFALTCYTGIYLSSLYLSVPYYM